MKKLFVLFVAVAATISSFAATKAIYFNRTQFQWSGLGEAFEELVATLVATNEKYDVQLTVPFVYRGTVALKADWAYEPAQGVLTLQERQAAPCLITAKSNLPAVMTLCQPCIDCYPCDVLDIKATEQGKVHVGILDEDEKVNVPYTGISEENAFGEPGTITNWNLYIVMGIDKDLELINIVKIDLLAAANPATFFTGAKGKNMYVKVRSEGKLVQMQLTGAKNDYKFKYYENYLKANDEDFGVWGKPVATAAQTAYIKSAKALVGSIYYNRYTPTADTTAADPQVEILDVAGTVKLTRDATWTGKAITGAFAAEVQKKGKGWDDCTIVAPAHTCEEYFFKNFEADYFNAAYKSYIKKDYLLNIVPMTAEAAFAAAYDVEERFLGFDAVAP